MQDLMTLTQAAGQLGVSPNTVTAWAAKLNIALRLHPYDKRIKMLAVEEVEEIRQALADRNGLVAVRPRALPAPPKTPRLPPAPAASSESKHSASQGHPSARDHPNRTYSTKPPLPEGWISFEEAWRLTGIAGNWEKSQADRDRWATAGPFLRDRATVWWALSPEQQEAFFAHFGRRG
jgi:hypothetical protein